MSHMKNFIEDVRAMILHGASLEYIASCNDVSVEMVEGALEILMENADFRELGDFDEPEPLYDVDDEPLSADDDGYIYGTDDDYGADFHDGEYAT
jgi:hypothetical protein